MDDQKESSTQQQNPNNDPPTTAISESVQNPKEPKTAAAHEAPKFLRLRPKWQVVRQSIQADWRRSGISKLEAKESWPLFLGVLAVAVAARTLCVISGQLDIMHGQLEKMGESNTISRETLVSAQRAFVFFSPEIQKFYVTDKEGSARIISWKFEIPIKNSGTTPAKNMSSHVFIEPLPHPITKGFNFHDFENGESSVAYPQDTTFYETETVPSAVLNETKSGTTTHLYIYGWTTYNDVFKGTPRRMTKFCFEVHAFLGDFTNTHGDKGHRITLCGFHNCSDDDCKAKNPN